MNRGTPMTLETSIYPSDPSIPFEGFYRTFPRKAVTIGYTIFPNFDSMFPYFPYIPLYSVIFHYIPLYSIIFHYIPLYSVIFHYIPLYSVYPMKSPFTVSKSVTSHSYDERFGSPPFPTGTWSIASRQVTLHNWSARGARKAGAFLGAWSWGTMDWIEIYIILYTVYIYNYI